MKIENLKLNRKEFFLYCLALLGFPRLWKEIQKRKKVFQIPHALTTLMANTSFKNLKRTPMFKYGVLGAKPPLRG